MNNPSTRQDLSRRAFLGAAASGALACEAAARAAHSTPGTADAGICTVPVVDDGLWVGQALVAAGSPFHIRLPIDAVESPGLLDARVSGEHGRRARTLEVAAEADAEGLTVAFDSTALDGLVRKRRPRFSAQRVDIELARAGRAIATVRLAAYHPRRAYTFPKCEVRVVGGASVPFVDGEPCGSLMGVVAHMGNRFLPGAVRQFAEAGVKHFNILMTPQAFWREDDTFDVEACYGYIERAVLRIMAQAAEARFLLRWHLYVPAWWLDRYPGEAIALDTGGRELRNTPGHLLQASYASPTWRRRASEILEATLRRIGQSPLADRLAGVRLAYGNCGEWNNWGYHEKSFPDYSPPMQRAFADWLEARYGGVEALHAAWGDAAARFPDDVVPARDARLDPDGAVARAMPAHTQAADYYTFWQEYTADTIEHFAKSVKKATAGRCLTGSYYGYYAGHLGAGPYHFQDSGHYALARLLESPWIDFLGGPYPYSDRLRNATLNGAFSSLPLHGKFWDSENDQRTHRSGEGNRQYGTTAGLTESIAVAKRDFINNLSKGSSYYFFDFVLGWYQDEEFMATVKRLETLDRFAHEAGRHSRAEVAVFVSESAVPLLSNANPAMRALARTLFWELDAAGAPWSLYLMSDIERADLSRCKLAIVANAYAVTDAELAATRDTLCAGARTVAFLHAPGLLTRTGLDAERARALTGLAFAVDEAAALERVTLDADGAGLDWTGDACRPLVTVADPNAVALGFANDGEGVAVAGRETGTHQTLFVACPGLTVPWLRWLYARAGVHLYTDGGEPFFACGPFLGLYSRTGGTRQIRLPGPVELVADVFAGRPLARDAGQVAVAMPEGRPDTILLYAGKERPLP
ncbi:MAG: beta-galactosidase [Candidatus Hydrogenedentes bacterium]|nr:beta-galactosidase [Candidatus Hydrogenedentota bacterium]